MSNTTNSEIRIKEIGGINFGEAFKNGQITSTFSINSWIQSFEI